MAQSRKRRLPTPDKIILSRLPILLERSIARQMLKTIERSPRMSNTLSDVFIQHCPWPQAALKLKEPWVDG
jgi:hypothetical protein